MKLPSGCDEVTKESDPIAVATVEPIPHCHHVSSVDVVGDERGFAIPSVGDDEP